MSPLPAGDLPQKPNSSTCREGGFLRSLALLLGPVALRLEDCATRARKFTATLAVPQPDAVQCEADFARCRTLVAQGRKSNFGANAASATGGTAAGTAVATTAVGSAVRARYQSCHGRKRRYGRGSRNRCCGTDRWRARQIRIAQLLRSSNEERLQDPLVLCLSDSNSKIAFSMP